MAQSLSKLYVHIVFHIKNNNVLILPEDEEELYAYIALTHHLKEYSGDKTTFKQIDKNYCQGFVEYLKTAIKYLPERGEAKDEDSVFKFPSGGYVNMQLHQWAFAAGLKKKISFHTLRHTAFHFAA